MHYVSLEISILFFSYDKLTLKVQTILFFSIFIYIYICIFTGCFRNFDQINEVIIYRIKLNRKYRKYLLRGVFYFQKELNLNNYVNNSSTFSRICFSYINKIFFYIFDLVLYKESLLSSNYIIIS